MPSDIRADSWKCYRCKIILPSPHDGVPPIECLQVLGGCGRSSDAWCEHETPDYENCEKCKTGFTRFFPEDWGDGKAELHIDAEMQEGARLFRDIIHEGERLFEFTDPWHYRMCSLYIFQSYFFRPLYPSVFYIAFTSGEHGAGKSKATRWVTELSHKGFMVGALTLPYLEREMDIGGTPGIDEVDALPSDLRTATEKMLRHGYERGAISGKVDDDGKKKTPKGYNIFAPKAFNFRGRPEEALMARTYAIPVVRVREGDASRRVALNEARLLRKDESLVARLLAFRDDRLKDWTAERVLKWYEDETTWTRMEEFRAAAPMTPRDIQLAFLCLLTADIIGIDIREEIRAALAASESYRTDDEAEELCHNLRRAWEEAGKPAYMVRSDLRKAVNVIRAESKDPPFTAKAFPRLLEKANLRIGNGQKRVPGEGDWAVYFNESTLKLLYPGGVTRNVFSFTERLDGVTNGGVGITGATSDGRTGVILPGEGVTILRRRGISHQQKSDRSVFAPEDLVSHPNEPDIDIEQIRRVIKKWLELGEVYQPNPNREEYRFP